MSGYDVDDVDTKIRLAAASPESDDHSPRAFARGLVWMTAVIRLVFMVLLVVEVIRNCKMG